MNCVGGYRRWWYDASNGVCKEFIFSGCGGNRNNFPTKNSCEEACAKYSNHQKKPLRHYALSKKLLPNTLR